MPREDPDTKHSEKRLSKTVLLCTVLFGGGTIFLLRGILVGKDVLSDSDILAYFFPLKSAIRALFRQGSSLLWNPLLGEGQPLAANPAYELFYPPTWLALFLPVASSLAIAQVAHLALSWFGTRRFLKALGRSETAALLGASMWAFGGVIASSMHLLPVFYAWAWIPWLLAELTARLPSVLRSAFFGAMVLLVGEPMSATMAILGGLTILVATGIERRRVLRSVSAAALSVLLSAAIILPGAGVAGKSFRPAGIPEEISQHKSFPAVRLVELVAPRLTGNTVPHRDRDYLGWRLYPEHQWPFFTGIYSGALWIPLFVVAVCVRFRRIRPLLVVSVVSFLFALGSATPVWSFLWRLMPLWRMFRYPEKFMALALFLAVAIVSSGFDEALGSPRVARRMMLGLAVAGAGLALAYLLSILGQGSILDPSRVWRQLPIENAVAFFRGTFLRAAAVYLVFGALFWWLSIPSGRAKEAVGFAIVAVASLDVLASSRDFIGTRPRSAMISAPPVVRRLLSVSPPPRLVDFLPENPPVPVAGAEVFNGPWDRNRLSGEQSIQWGIPLALDADYDLTQFAASNRARRLMTRVAAENPRAFSRLLAGRSDSALLVWKQPIKLEDPVTVVGVPGLRPEIDSVLAWERFDGDEGFLRSVQQQRGDLSRVAFVERDFSGLPPTVTEAKISVQERRNTGAEFVVDAPAACLVRIAWTNDGNWRARIDGRPWPVRTVDISLIGLLIPAGRHSVSLWYSDRLVTIGIVISALAWTGLLIGFLLRWGGGTSLTRIDDDLKGS